MVRLRHAVEPRRAMHVILETLMRVYNVAATGVAFLLDQAHAGEFIWNPDSARGGTVARGECNATCPFTVRTLVSDYST